MENITVVLPYDRDFSHQPLCLQFFIKILLYYFKNNPLNFLHIPQRSVSLFSALILCALTLTTTIAKQQNKSYTIIFSDVSTLQ